MAVPAHLRLEFVTPERSIAHEDVDEVVIPGEEGSFGVLPGHAPLLSALKPGELWYRKGADRRHTFVAGGFAEVLPDRVTILAPIAEHAEDIDIQRAEAAKRRAEEHLAQSTSAADAERARNSLIRAVARLEISREIRRSRR
jgi:F-type H+-transporting ATPase subunit epsilon